MTEQGWITLFVGFIGICAGVGGQLISSSVRGARTETRLDTLLAEIRESFKDCRATCRAEQDEQWTKIHATAEDVAKLKGALGINGGRAKGLSAHAGAD